MPNLDLALFLLFLGLMLDNCASKCPRVRKNRNLRVNYGFQRRLAYFRCRKGYDLIGSKSAVCNGDKWSTEFPICIAPGCPLLEYDETVLDVTYTYRASLATFQCKANYVMEDEDNRVYCNKTNWNKPPPICTKNSLQKSCDYEDGICGWTQDWSDQFDWKIHSKETSTKFTGPSNDHTHGNTKEGHYIYIEASAPRRNGDQARLLSPLYNFKMKSVCFEFWFHMWCPSSETTEVGSLDVYAIPVNRSSSTLAPLKTLTGDHGNNWIRERIQIGKMQESFQIILQATRGLNHQNDIGVDDVRLWEGLCDDPPQTAETMSDSSETSTLSSSLKESITVDSVITGKENLQSISSIQPTVMTSTVNTPVYEVMTDGEFEKEILLTRISSSTERKVSITNAKISQTTDFTSQKAIDSSSLTSVTVPEAEDQDNLSNKKGAMGKISTGRSRKRIENYTSLAIGITVVLLLGIFVIFLIVWIWARSQDRKRRMAEEDEEEVQPITNAVSVCSVPNSFSSMKP